jgi:hypothetical protein
MTYLKNIFCCFILLMIVSSCNKFEELNTNPNEPTSVTPDVVLPGAIRQSVNASVDASYLVGNIAAQINGKTLRLEVDAYTWNAFPSYWTEWYEALTNIKTLEGIAINSNNEVLEGVAITLRAWIFETLTTAYGNIPYSEAIGGEDLNFTPVYDEQSFIYSDLLSELERAEGLLTSGNGTIGGDLLLNGDAAKWQKFANSLKLRLLMHAGDKISDVGGQFSKIFESGDYISSNADNVALTYTGSSPNEFPLVPLKIGDFDAVALSKTARDILTSFDDPRLMRYARPDNDDYSTYDPALFTGDVNGTGACDSLTGSRLGSQYYNYPGFVSADNLGLPMAQGIIMTYAEVEFILAEAAANGWINSDIETHYKAGISASMEYHQVDLALFAWTDFEDFYNNSGVAYSEVTDIWQQKWIALFFHGLEPYFEVRRWYVLGGNSFDGIPFLEPACGNENNDMLPLRFLYPGEEQSANAENYQAAVTAMGGSNSQNAAMWIAQ